MMPSQKNKVQQYDPKANETTEINSPLTLPDTHTWSSRQASRPSPTHPLAPLPKVSTVQWFGRSWKSVSCPVGQPRAVDISVCSHTSPVESLTKQTHLVELLNLL